MEKNQEHRTISEQNGIDEPQNTNIESTNNLRSLRSTKISIPGLHKKIISGDISALGRAITLVESENSNHHRHASEIIEKCLPNSGKSIRIGITGVPGVGKSTFIEALGTHYSKKGHKVAVLAVDPTSNTTKGSILGDKTRMETLAGRDNVFIRPTPSGNSLGGVSRKTRESIILCEAAGYDIIIIETVGVGQSEIAVHSMVDFFLLLKLAGAGDELQGIKRGIIEMADLIVINKADNDNVKAAKKAKLDFTNALHLYPPKTSGWQPKVLLCSALYDEGIDQIMLEIEAYLHLVKDFDVFDEKRLNQQEYWLYQTIEERLKNNFYQRELVQTEIKKQLKLIRELKTTAYNAAEYLLNL